MIDVKDQCLSVLTEQCVKRAPLASSPLHNGHNSPKSLHNANAEHSKLETCDASAVKGKMRSVNRFEQRVTVVVPARENGANWSRGEGGPCASRPAGCPSKPGHQTQACIINYTSHFHSYIAPSVDARSSFLLLNSCDYWY